MPCETINATSLLLSTGEYVVSYVPLTSRLSKGKQQQLTITPLITLCIYRANINKNKLLLLDWIYTYPNEHKSAFAFFLKGNLEQAL